MWIFIDKRTLGLVFLIVFAIIAIYVLKRAEKGKTKPVRTLPGLFGIEDGIKRCVETGRPVFFTTAMGGGGLYSSQGAAHMAGISILGYVARLTARLGSNLIMVTPYTELVPVAEDVIKESYMMEGHADAVTPDMVRYLSGYSHTFKMAYVGMLVRENPACSILMGPLWSSDALQMTEPGTHLGAIQIGGADNMNALAMMSLTCDYVLLGEELYCAAAYASEDKVQLNIIFGADILKLGVIAIILIGFILTMLGINVAPFFDF